MTERINALIMAAKEAFPHLHAEVNLTSRDGSLELNIPVGTTWWKVSDMEEAWEDPKRFIQQVKDYVVTRTQLAGPRDLGRGEWWDLRRNKGSGGAKVGNRG